MERWSDAFKTQCSNTPFRLDASAENALSTRRPAASHKTRDSLPDMPRAGKRDVDRNHGQGAR